MSGDRSDGPADEVAGELLEVIGRLRRRARRAADDPVLPHRSDLEREVLRMVRRRPGSSVSEVAGRLGLAATTVSTLVTRLTRAGLLLRTVDPSDRRAARLDLSDAARDRVESWRDRRAAVAGRALADLSPSDRAAITAAIPALRALTERLDADQAPR